MNFDHALAGIADFLGFEDSLDTVQSIRGLLDASAALLNEDLPDVGAFQASIPYREADGRQLTLDVIRPKGAGPFPVLVYIHGGAWVWGSPATHRKLTFRLAQQGFLVFSVDYRLAPEHPFPAAFHDCIHAVHFAAHNAGRWDGDPGRIVLAGDSAGANLAAATAIDLAGTPGTPTVAAVGLIYGVFDFSIQDDDTLDYAGIVFQQPLDPGVVHHRSTLLEHGRGKIDRQACVIKLAVEVTGAATQTFGFNRRNLVDDTLP